MQNVPWSSTEEYDLTDLQRELDEFLVNALDWAGITTRADERVYVADEYWDVEETERDLTIYENPIEDVVQYERDLAVHDMTSAELTAGERRVLETIVDGGRELHYNEIADWSDTSKSTVYRAAKKLGGVLRTANGMIDCEDTIIRKRMEQLFARVDDAVEWAENGIEALAENTGLLVKESALAQWARTYGAEVSRRGDSDEIEIHGGEFDRYEMSKILRNGYRAACAVGSKTAARFTDATFAWFDTAGDRVVRESAFVYHGTALKALGWEVRPPP